MFLGKTYGLAALSLFVITAELALVAATEFNEHSVVRLMGCVSLKSGGKM